MSATSISVSYKQDGYGVVMTPAPEDAKSILGQIDGTRRSDSWEAPRVQVVMRGENGERLNDFDVSCIGSPGLAMVVGRKVVDQLGGFLLDYGELLPVACNEMEMFIYNPVVLLNGLDVSASEVSRFPDGRMYAIWKHVFAAKAVEGAVIFRIPELRRGPTFFSDQAVAMWKKCGFRGIDFREVWPNPKKETKGRPQRVMP